MNDPDDVAFTSRRGNESTVKTVEKILSSNTQRPMNHYHIITWDGDIVTWDVGKSLHGTIQNRSVGRTHLDSACAMVKPSASMYPTKYLYLHRFTLEKGFILFPLASLVTMQGMYPPASMPSIADVWATPRTGVIFGCCETTCVLGV